MLAILFQEKTKKNAEKNASTIEKGLVAYTVSRYQGGKEMSALRPYKTAPFLPPALLAPYTKIIFSIYKPVSDIYSMSYLLCVLKHSTFVIYACAIARPLISRFSTILKLFCPLCGSYWYEI